MFRIIIVKYIVLFIKITFSVIIFATVIPTCLYSESFLLLNPGFETGSGGKPSHWNYDLHNNSEDYTEITWQKGNAHSGNYCVLINNKQPNDTRIIQNINLEGKSIYKASCWIKAQNIGLNKTGANISVRALTKISRYIVGTTDNWQNIEVFIKTGEKAESIFLTIGIGTYGAVNTGKAWIDDVKLEKVSLIPKDSDIISLKKEEPEQQKKKSVLIKSMDSVLFIYLGFLIFLIVFFIIGRLKKNKNEKIIKDERNSIPETDNTSIERK